jgi:hypothetical protein
MNDHRRSWLRTVWIAAVNELRKRPPERRGTAVIPNDALDRCEAQITLATTQEKTDDANGCRD